MKKTTLLALTLASSSTLFADPIDSQVIHDYTEVRLGYAYSHDLGNSGVNAHGVVGGASYEIKNFVVGVGGSYSIADDDFGVGADMTEWSAGGEIGYVIRVLENRLNVIPNCGLGYSEVTVDAPGFGETSEGTTIISPGLELSFALNNRWSVNAGYSYSRALDEDDLDGHGLTIGTVFALTERVGLSVRAGFAEDYGFVGISTVLAYHF